MSMPDIKATVQEMFNGEKAASRLENGLNDLGFMPEANADAWTLFCLAYGVFAHLFVLRDGTTEERSALLSDFSDMDWERFWKTYGPRLMWRGTDG